MCYDEFRKLVMDTGVEKELNERDMALCFNLSMVTQLDELDSYRMFEMSYVEYLEGFARLADKIS